MQWINVQGGLERTVIIWDLNIPTAFGTSKARAEGVIETLLVGVP